MNSLQNFFYEKRNFLKYFLLIILISLPLFINLDKLPLYIWDEARLAANAVEMAGNGHFITTYFEGVPDMWNTKPPLMIWLQVILLKLIGYNELAIRLPSALAALFTCILLIVFFRKQKDGFALTFFSCLILITSYGYIKFHTARAGDYDSLLTLFTTAYFLLFFVYTESNKEKYIIPAFAMVTLAILTKGVAALFFAPSIFIYLLIRNKLLSLLKSKHFYIGLSGTIIIVAGYYLLRESENPGYLKAIWLNELGGRYYIEPDERSPDFYIIDLVNKQFDFYWYFIIPGLICGLLFKNKFLNNLSIYLIINIILFLAIISFSAVKKDWYIMPIYPQLSILSALFLFAIYNGLLNRFSSQNFVINTTGALSLICTLIFIKPYYSSFKLIEYADDTYTIIESLKKYNPENNKDTLRVIQTLYFSPLNFYMESFAEKKSPIIRINNLEHLKCGDKVLAEWWENHNYIENHYYYLIINELFPSKTYKIICPNNSFDTQQLSNFPESQEKLKEMLPDIIGYIESVKPGILKTRVNGSQKTIMDGFSSLIMKDPDMIDSAKYKARWITNHKNNFDSRTDVSKAYGFPDSSLNKPNVALYLFPHAVYWAQQK